ncbi:MAG: hypothetical protein RQ982_07620, partial [Gammaproteobacteria bacterium]|nr:hypothetical protein [Gammaproteobacteria bacterium]
CKLLHLSTRLFIFAILSLQFHSVQAIPETNLEDWIFNVDGDISENFFGDPIPTTGTLVDGFGTLSLEITGGGAHNIIGYFDFEIFEDFNTFFNESGSATGTPAIGQSWEIDEPGFIFGDIVDNVLLGSLDNSNGVPTGFEDDVAFALGWDFVLLDDDAATISYIFSDIVPTVDFFLTQTDPDLGESMYFYSVLDVISTGGPAGPQPDPVDVPEPPIAFLILSAALLMFLRNRLLLRSRVDSFLEV